MGASARMYRSSQNRVFFFAPSLLNLSLSNLALERETLTADAAHSVAFALVGVMCGGVRPCEAASSHSWPWPWSAGPDPGRSGVG